MIYTQGSQKDYAKAFKWLRRAAKRGDANAQFNLGRLYEAGDGIDKNLERAAKWYLLAAEQDHSKAQANLGWLYINGAGVEEDLDEAEKWYKRSESLGKYPKKKDRN